MLFNLLLPLLEAMHLPGEHLLRFTTFRVGCAIVTALAICLITGPGIIRWLRSRQGEGQPIRSDGPETHFKKKGTPTMGGVMILIATVVSTLLWADLRVPYVWLVLLVTLGFGAIGFGDDYLKLTKRNTAGLPGRLKLLGQFVIGGVFICATMYCLPAGLDHHLALPFLKDQLWDMGWWLFVPFALVVLVGSSNAVNLTDGLDGLAIVPVMIAAGTFGLICYLVGSPNFADYLGITSVEGTTELTVLCGALVGASMGFLWFNAPPAKVFMGDTGSLALGGALGAIAIVTKHEIVLAIVGGLFVLEAVSVIVQVASFKLTGKRVFRMAPLHHHFEKKGWAESTVVIRFWIISMVLALAGLATLKLR